MIMSAPITGFVKSLQLQLPFLFDSESSSYSNLVSRLEMFSRGKNFLSRSVCSSVIPLSFFFFFFFYKSAMKH